MATTQTITAIYENGVLTPLEKVRLRKRQKVRVKISPLNGQKRKRASSSRKTSRPSKRVQQIKLARESFGMWADRDDINDVWLTEIRAGWNQRFDELYKND